MNLRSCIILYLSILVCSGVNANEQTNPSFELFLFSIKNKNFSAAEENALEFSNEELKVQSVQLIEVLRGAGQEELFLIDYKNSDKITKAIYNLGKGYYLLYTNPYSTKPFELFSEVFQLAKDLKNKELERAANIAILDVYNYEINQSNDDRIFYLKNLESLIDDPSDEFHFKLNLLLYNLKNVFYKVELNEDFAIDFGRLIQNFPISHNFWPMYYATVGVLYEALGKQEMAIKFHQEAINIIKDEPFLKHLKFRSNIRLSEIMRRSNKFNEALVYIDKAEKHLSKADSLRGLYYLNLYTSNNFAGLSQYESAYFKLKESSDQGNRLDYKKNTAQISSLNVKYKTAEKEKQILIERQQKEKNRNLALGLGGLLMFGGLIFFLVQKNTTKKRKLAEQEALLEQQKVETLLKEQELVSIDAMIAGQEKERTKVANELHDDLGSLMATVKLHFDNVQADQKDPALKNAQKLLDEAYQKIRGMAHSKNSGVMTNQGLLPAVEKMAKTISETNALMVTVEDFGLGERMENSLELNIFRMIQELVANIIKHAEATRAAIQFTQHEDNLNIIIEDNGKGFDMSEVKRTQNGMGLGTIEKRIEHLEGTFTVDSVHGKGTSILIDIPI